MQRRERAATLAGFLIRNGLAKTVTASSETASSSPWRSKIVPRRRHGEVLGPAARGALRQGARLHRASQCPHWRCRAGPERGRRGVRSGGRAAAPSPAGPWCVVGRWAPAGGVAGRCGGRWACCAGAVVCRGARRPRRSARGRGPSAAVGAREWSVVRASRHRDAGDGAIVVAVGHRRRARGVARSGAARGARRSRVGAQVAHVAGGRTARARAGRPASWMRSLEPSRAASWRRRALSRLSVELVLRR